MSGGGTDVKVKVTNPTSNAYAINSITFVAATGFNFTSTGSCGTTLNNVAAHSASALACAITGSNTGILPGFSDTIDLGGIDGPTVAASSSPSVGTFTTSVVDASSTGAYTGPTFTVTEIAPPGGFTLAFSVTGSTFTAGSSPVTVTATIASGEPGVPVSFSNSGSGSFASSTVNTGSTGAAADTFTPSNTAGSDTITASVKLATAVSISGALTTVAAAPSKITFQLNSATFPKQYNITSSNHVAKTSSLSAYFTTSGVTYSLADAFGNAVTSGVTFTSGGSTLTGGSFWNNVTTTTQVSGTASYSGHLTDFGAAAASYEQSGAYGSTGMITATITGTYNSAGFSATGTSGTLFTSLFDSSANTVNLVGVSHTAAAAGSTITVQYSLTRLQSGVSVKITAQENANASAGFTDGSWSGGATAYKHTTGSLAAVTVTTGTAGTASATFVLPTQASKTVTFIPSIKYSIDGAAPSTTTITGASNSTTTAAGKLANFAIQVLYDTDGGDIVSSAVAGAKLNVVAYLTDSYGNLKTSPGFQVQISLSASTGASTLSATNVYIASGNAKTNDSGSFGLVQWALPSTATGTVTVTASGIYTSATASVSIVSANPTNSISKVNGNTYTSGTVYTSSSSIAVTGKAKASAGYESGDVTIANVNASLNAAKSASFTTSASWSYVNPTAFATGTNTIAFVAIDSNGAASSTSTLSVVYDPNAPTITFPTTLTINSGQSIGVTITTGASDLNTTSIAVSVNGTATTNFSFSGSTLTISGLSAGHKSVAVTAATLAKLSATVTKVVTVNVPTGSTFTSSAGASSATSGGFKGAQITFTNNAAASETVNVYFVWYNSANQVVSVGAQLNVVFAAGASATFFGSYQTSGTYTVKVFIQDSTGNGLSSSYSTTVTI